MTKTKKTKNTTFVVMPYFIKHLNEINELFVDSNEEITSIWIKQDLNDNRFLKARNLAINTSETVNGEDITREYVFRNGIISKDHLEMIYFSKNIKEDVA